MVMQRVRAVWSGNGVVGGGVSTFYAEADGSQQLPVAINELFSAVKSLMPSGCTVTVPNGGDLIDEATGDLTGTWGTSITTAHVGTGTDVWAAGVGARVVWDTGAVRNGRRVRGSTFIVPLTSVAYASDGTLGINGVGFLQDGVTAFLAQITDGGRVWSRPTPTSAGASVPITGGRVPDKVSWLRSRRV